MKKLGKIYNITKEGLIVIESNLKDPRKLVNSTVYDRDLKPLGKIVDVIGRVDTPYVVVKPFSPDIASFIEIGSTVYYRYSFKKRREGKTAKKKKRRKGKGRAGSRLGKR